MSHRSALCIAVFCVRYTNMDAVVPSVRNSDFLLVGGMVEQWHEPSQRWRLDHRCRQLHVHNYTLSQVWGYQATQRACMVCSSISEVRHAATYRRWWPTGVHSHRRPCRCSRPTWRNSVRSEAGT